MLNVPVNNFSVMLGRSHRFLGITSTWGGGGGGKYERLSCNKGDECCFKVWMLFY